MSGRRRVLAYRIVAVVGVLIAVLAGARVLRLARGADAVEGRRITVCSAPRDLLLGEALPTEVCAPLALRERALPPDALRSAEDLAGRVVATPVIQGTVITERHLGPRDRHGADAIVPPGLRAVRVSPADGFTPGPGSLVDVVAAASAEFESRASATVVARRARVVTDRANERDPSVLLIVTPEQAQRIAAARVTGELTLAVLPPEEGRPPGAST